MLLVLHAIVLAVVWVASPAKTTIATALSLIAAFWVIARALGFGAGRITSILVTLTLLATCFWTFSQGSNFDSALKTFTYDGLAVMLAIVVWLDLTEFHHTHVANFSGRRKMRDFIMQHGLRILWFGVICLIVSYALLVPLLEDWQLRRMPKIGVPKMALDRMTLQQTILFRFCESITAIFFFVVGTCVGSFLNVVIYRAPQGFSVLVKPSHCPGCSEKILGRDNLPIIGWLKLKGCCRNCGITISSRYPTVELTIGLTFLILYFVELISGGANLPGRPQQHYAGVLWILFYTKWDLVGLYFIHCLLICTLFSWAMIRRDGYRVPHTTVLLMFTLIAVPTFIWPHLQPYPGLNAAVPPLIQTYSTTGAAITSGLGLFAGLSIALLARVKSLIFNWTFVPHDIPSWMLLGLTVGWQATCGVLAVTLAWQLLSFIHRSILDIECQNRVTSNFYLTLPWTAFIHLCLWRSMCELVIGI